jgi:hypothetical protein
VVAVSLALKQGQMMKKTFTNLINNI